MIKKKDVSIIGSGFLAKKFKKYKKFLKRNNFVVYAAGVSNSSEKNRKVFYKEFLKIKRFCKFNKKKIIYISTYSINDKSRFGSKYVKNKIKIENLIKNEVINYNILRLPEIIGSSKNPNTLTNFFYNCIKNNITFNLYKNTKRNLLDVEDAISACIKIIKMNKKNFTINILNKSFYTPFKIVKGFETVLNKKAIYRIKSIRGKNLKFKNTFYLKFNSNYLIKVIKKYYK